MSIVDKIVLYLVVLLIGAVIGSYGEKPNHGQTLLDNGFRVIDPEGREVEHFDQSTPFQRNYFTHP